MKLLVISVLAALALGVGAEAGLGADGFVFVPSNPPAMKPVADRNSPAHQAAKLFLRGINLGNYLESGPETGRRATMPVDDFDIMRAEGFDHVRIPTAWHQYTGPAPDFKLSPDIFGRVDFVVTNALARKLAVIINIHHFEAFTSNPAPQTEKFLALWRQIAAHYANSPEPVAFELLNEPKETATTLAMNPIYALAIAEIRKTNPRRTILVEPGSWGNAEELKNLVLPADDHNLIVSVHCYDPFYFTHQGATWAGPDVKVTGIQFPGPPPVPLVPDASLRLNRWVEDWIQRYNTLPSGENPSGPRAFTDKLRLARAWSDYYGRPIHVGEFGCFTTADPQSRARFHAAIRRMMDEQKLGWAMWDWNSNFRYWDRRNQQPAPGMREALFGKP